MPADRDACQAFMDLHQQDGLFVMPNPWDIGTTRILGSMGFKALASASWALSFAQGVRDGEGAVPRDMAVEHAAMIAQATDLPVNGDLENGFGDDPNDVRETVLNAIDAGLAGCSIEDATGDPLIPLYDGDLAIERIIAARTAINETGLPFVLTARCEAFLMDFDDPFATIMRRLPRFVEAGADVIYAPGITDAKQISTLVRDGGAPVNVLGGIGPHPLLINELESLGVRRVSLGPQLVRAAIGGFMRAAAELAGEGSFGFVRTNARADEINPFLYSPREDRGK